MSENETKTEMPTKKRERLPNFEKLQAQKEAILKKQQEIDAKIRAGKLLILKKERKARTAENAAIRKAETRKKIEYGGLVKIAGLLETDKGALLGVLLWAAKKFKEEPDSVESFKKRGDVKLEELENEKKRRIEPLITLV
jgi:hypothetical protein